ncbi:hypothetical protein [Leptospira interrogans]|uniref:N-terminal Ras-GEF domain-containing protein n=1 Tax=Leptospira interrogans serovar Bataviae TaxID=312175 RepID=A0AAQ0B486_LEPIR|nr:hypothetical protein [Leptospira interrogans]QOI53105.1 hypothetical protein Lepto1489_22320 [Leptospira interrogans serovar Bataviae]
MNFERIIEAPFRKILIKSNQEKYLMTDVIGNTLYHQSFSKSNVFFEINFNFPINLREKKSYRELMFDKGVYLGHHIGKEANLKISKNKIEISNASFDTNYNYNKVFWNYVIKFVLSVQAAENSALSLKGSLLKYGKMNFLLLGRGNSGKTSISKAFLNHGFSLIANTHSIIKDSYVWGFNTWIRVRDSVGKESYELMDSSDRFSDGNLNYIILYEFNSLGKFSVSRPEPSFCRAFILYFSSSIANYDLKEDLADYFRDDNFIKKYEFLSNELKMIEKLVTGIPTYHVTCDIESEESVFELINFLKEL